MASIITILALIASGRRKSNYIEITFYERGKRVMQVETASDHYTTLPIKTTTGKVIYADSMSVKIK